MDFEKELKQIPKTISIFPLPSTVFYPKTHLPLHIFEPRYREMVSDTLKGTGLIGMVLLQPGWEANYFYNPDTNPIGCVGKIDQIDRLQNGRYNMALYGLSRFRIEQEETGKSYRQATIQLLEDRNDIIYTSRNQILENPLVEKYKKYIRMLPPKKRVSLEFGIDQSDSLSHLVDSMAFHLDIEAREKQKILEEQDPRNRALLLDHILDLKLMIVEQSKMRLDENINNDLN